MKELLMVWEALQGFDGTKLNVMELPLARVKFYMGAMEIPMISFSPKEKFRLDALFLERFSEFLKGYHLELDCVAEGSNYKINRSEDGLYIGRVTQDALKLHAIRIKELSLDLFVGVVSRLLEYNG